MSPQEFVDAVRQVVSNQMGNKLAKMFENPSGGKPSDSLQRQSRWFNSLSAEDKSFVIEAMQTAAEHATFGVLCVIDGVRAIEPQGPKGELELYFVKDGKKTRVNSEPLHDLYNAN
jgi:hypothetical protein